MRVAANSDVPFCALNINEQTERLANLNVDRKDNHRALRRAAEKLTEVEEELFINEETLSHMEKAMKNMATKKEDQVGLEETIFEALKQLETNGEYTKNEPITRASCKDFVEVIVSHAKNWVCREGSKRCN